VEAAPLLVDGVGQCAAGGAAALRRQTGPEEGVVPDLGCVIENAALGGTDDLDQVLVLELGAGDQLVEVGDIGLVVLAVVVIQRFGAHVRGQGVFGERQGR